MKNAKLSIVIPINNEEGTLPVLYERLVKTLKGMSAGYEVIFVNDGSSDRSLQIIKELAQNDGTVKLLSLSRKFGHQIAVTAGLKYASGDAVIVMDGDLQDPPEIVTRFVQKWQEGYDVVYGMRTSRKESLVKRVLYFSYYRLLKTVSAINIPLDSGDCCLMNRRVVDIINSLPEKKRFIRGLRSWVGFSQIGVEYDRDERYAGETKYSFYNLLELALDGMLSFSNFPLRPALILGLLIVLMSVGTAILLVCLAFFHTGPQMPGWIAVLIGVAFFGGIQLIVLGLLGEYIIRIYNDSQHRPLYIVDEVVGFENVAASVSDNTGV